MPDFEFRGASPGMYPMLRDAYGVPAGTVKPGDVLHFEEAPDGDWVPYEAAGGIASEADPAATPAASGHDHDDTAGQTGSEEQ